MATDTKRLADTLVRTYAIYGKELTRFDIEVWANVLDGVDADIIDAAFVRHLRDTGVGMFLPKPANVLRQIRGDDDEQALIAWGEVIAAARDGGRRFEGATQQAIDSMGGMGRLRLASESENGHLQRQFVAAYKAYRSHADTPPLLALTTAGRAGVLSAG